MMQVYVRHIIEPCTFSCGLIVEVPKGSGMEDIPRTAFLKLFDRRLAAQLRKTHGIDPWTCDMEESFVTSSEHQLFCFHHNLEHIPDFKNDTEEDWDNAENEAFLASELRRQHATELAVYQRLQRYHGFQVPRLYASVSMSSTTPLSASSWQRKFLFTVPGLLVEHISGFPLSDIKSAPTPAWQGIVNQAVRSVHLLAEYNVANEDVRLHNFLVCPDRPGHYRVVMIDFAMCRFRHPVLTDFQWGRLKCNLDEANGVGMLMQKILSNHGIKIDYKIDERYFPFAETEAEDGNENEWSRFLREGGGSKKREPCREMSI